ncbi:MAG: monovalent cation/H+ antiporter complex subunit F, partial [Planctomycetota bacterium]
LEMLPDMLMAAAPSMEAASESASHAGHGPMGKLLVVIAQVGVLVLVLGILLCLYRMIKGPHLADRVLAGDTVAMLVAGLVVMLAIKFDSALFYDAALVVAILGFVSTVAFAQYIGAKNKFAPDPNAEDGEDAA